LLLQNDLVNHQFEATQSQKRIIDRLKRDHFEEAIAENIFCFSVLRKVRPSRERPICPQQEIQGEPGLLALQAKDYHRFNWEEVTRCTMADGKAMVHHHFHLKS